MNGASFFFTRILFAFIFIFSLVDPAQAQQSGNADSSSVTQDNYLVENAGDSDQINLLTATAAQVSAGGSHTCALTTFGGVKCWGDNFYGQLGDGTTTRRTIPTDVLGLTSGVISVSAGNYHTCALTTTGGVKCWGNNWDGELGIGTVTSPQSSPIDVISLSSGVIMISAGYSHTCALLNSGGIKCWGDNRAGQLGDGSLSNRTTPVDVVGLTTGVSAVSTGNYFTCAKTDSSGAKCWGLNNYGQLGDGTTSNHLMAVDVIGLSSGVSAISSGGNHACIRTSIGGAKCWGSNNSGKLGDGTTTNRMTPVDVVGLTSSVNSISVGSGYTCALTDSTGVKCWGSNSFGEIGDGIPSMNTTPMEVIGVSTGVSAISTGFGHICALTILGGIKCWGWNASGQLGNNTIAVSTSPINAIGMSSEIGAISGGDSHSCALNKTGGVKCWGLNSGGQLGDGTNIRRSIAVNVIGVSSGVIAISTGGHTCAVTNVGGAMCWGGNSYGQLGDGTTTSRITPVDVVGLGNGVSAVSAGLFHTCGLTSSGGIKCWGLNDSGQLGNGTTIDSTTPVDVIGLSNGVHAISVGEAHTCAVDNSGGVKCWGDNSYGQLGDGTTTDHVTPVEVNGLSSGVSSISAGYYHTCALTVSGGVKCWGLNYYGELGDGTTTNRITPTDVVGLSNGMSSVSSGDVHTCALTTLGGVMCWGNNSVGQLGDGTMTNRTTPVDVSGLINQISAISVGEAHNCAVTKTGSVKCWGYNAYGQLGDGYVWAPVNVVGFGEVNIENQTFLPMVKK